MKKKALLYGNWKDSEKHSACSKGQKDSHNRKMLAKAIAVAGSKEKEKAAKQ